MKDLAPQLRSMPNGGLDPHRWWALVQGSGALLFGEKTLERFVQVDQSLIRQRPFFAWKMPTEVVGIGELGIGIEIGKRLANGYCLSLRGLYEGQLWAEAGGAHFGLLGL